MNRNETRPIKVKDLTLGGSNHIFIQSMCNIKTSKVEQVIRQIKELENLGCEIIRVSIMDDLDCQAIKDIKKNITITLVGDIH